MQLGVAGSGPVQRGELVRFKLRDGEGAHDVGTVVPRGGLVRQQPQEQPSGVDAEPQAFRRTCTGRHGRPDSLDQRLQRRCHRVELRRLQLGVRRDRAGDEACR